MGKLFVFASLKFLKIVAEISSYTNHLQTSVTVCLCKFNSWFSLWVTKPNYSAGFQTFLLNLSVFRRPLFSIRSKPSAPSFTQVFFHSKTGHVFTASVSSASDIISHPSFTLCPNFITNFMCILYYKRDATSNVLYYYWRSTYFGRYFHPSSGAYKTVCAALGIIMLSCCPPLGVYGLEQPIHTSGGQQESMTIPKAAHTVL
jgi:hypothetical protein